MIKASVWKMTLEKNATECLYRVQVVGIKGTREENRVLKAMEGWEDAGGGYNSKTQEITMSFSKNFKSVNKFVQWGKSFQEFPLVELDKHGVVKKYVRFGTKGPKDAPSVGSQRVCGKCGKAGHNARTCGTESTTKPVNGGSRTCRKCGEKGHNSRTCKSDVTDPIRVEKVAKVKGKRRCGSCGEYGHNKATCSKQ